MNEMSSTCNIRWFSHSNTTPLQLPSTLDHSLVYFGHQFVSILLGRRRVSGWPPFVDLRISETVAPIEAPTVRAFANHQSQTTTKKGGYDDVGPISWRRKLAMKLCGECNEEVRRWLA